MAMDSHGNDTIQFTYLPKRHLSDKKYQQTKIFYNVIQ